jgi:hypothetical protein
MITQTNQAVVNRNRIKSSQANKGQKNNTRHDKTPWFLIISYKLLKS